MSELAILAATVKEELGHLATQAAKLAEGLQNVAPGSGTPNHSIEYLLAISDAMEKTARKCDVFLGPSFQEMKP